MRAERWNRLPRIMAGLRSSYDVIIVDSPPLGAGVDPFVLSTLTDLLRTDGHQVLEAPGGRDGLRVARADRTEFLATDGVSHQNRAIEFQSIENDQDVVTKTVRRVCIADGRRRAGAWRCRSCWYRCGRGFHRSWQARTGWRCS